MSKIQKIEDILVWKKSMESCDKIYRITNGAPFNKDFSLKDQIRRAAVSIPSNIGEGFERESNNQFIYFLVIAKGSTGELRTQLQIAFHQNYMSEKEFEVLFSQYVEISKMLSGFITYLRGKRKPGKGTKKTF